MIQSIDRAIRVLTALQGARRMSLSELAARLELAPSTTHGIVRSLVEHGMVVQERGSSRYQLGPAVLRLGNVYLDTLELRSRVAPWAEDLARRTGLAVRTAVMLVEDVVVVHTADATLVIPAARAQDVRGIVEELKQRDWSEYL